MHWNEIIVKSFEYVKKHRYLWWLGLLAALTEGSVSGSNYSGYSSSSWDNLDESRASQVVDAVTGWIGQNIDLVIIGLAATFIISLILLYVSYSARAGLISAVDKLEGSEKQPTFASSFAAGQKYFWRLLGMTMLVALMIFAAVIVFIALLVTFILLCIWSLWFLILVIPLGIALISGIVFLAIYLNAILLLATRALIIENLSITRSLKAGKELINKHFFQVLLGWLINIGLSMAAGLAVMLSIMLVGGALALIGVGIYFLTSTSGVIIYAIPFSLIFIIALWIIAGIVNAYFSTFWTLVYTKLKG